MDETKTPCRVDRCKKLISPFHLMCLSHWVHVPMELRVRIADLRRKGHSRSHPTRIYLQAVTKAISIVEKKIEKYEEDKNGES